MFLASLILGAVLGAALWLYNNTGSRAARRAIRDMDRMARLIEEERAKTEGRR